MPGVAGGQGSPMRSSRRGVVMTGRVAREVRCTRSALLRVPVSTHGFGLELDRKVVT
jgi:hypothetical protein